MATHVFISYVRENSPQVERICEILKAADVDVWIDRERLMPGHRWKDGIRHAIEDGAFFIACFSKEYLSRTKSFMSKELDQAIDMLLQTPRERAWFIAVSLDGSQAPDWSINSTERLRDLQLVDLSHDWAGGMSAILKVITDELVTKYPVQGAEAKRQVAEEFRINRALHVYDEWHAPILHESRIQVSNFLELVRESKIPSLPTLTDFEISQRESNNLSPYADHFFRVIHFFERWALLYTEKLLDHSLASRLLGSYVKWYQQWLFLPLETGEVNSDFVRLIKIINAMASSNEIQKQSTSQSENSEEQ